MAEDPIQIGPVVRLKPACPRCGSQMILIGRLSDAMGHPVQFSLVEPDGSSRGMGEVRSCYCNDCGEVTLTLS